MSFPTKPSTARPWPPPRFPRSTEDECHDRGDRAAARRRGGVRRRTFRRLARPADGRLRAHLRGVVRRRVRRRFHCEEKAMIDNKAMDDEIEQQEIPGIEFADELVDEALDRSSERCHCYGGCQYCL